MARVKLTVIESRCRDGLCRTGDEYTVEGVCPPMCHELWSCIYPQVFALLCGGELDCGEGKARSFEAGCPDGARVRVRGELLPD